jgi:ribosomal protein S18 acetylase RimI-like enzyme
MRPAIADVSEIGTGLFLINRINVPQEHRGKGYGTQILDQILKDADQERVTLVLEVYASDMRGIMTKDKLIEWYRRHGFHMVNHAQGLMERRNNGRIPSFKEKFTQFIDC